MQQLFLLGHLYFSGMWVGVTSRIDINKACAQKQLEFVPKLWKPF